MIIAWKEPAIKTLWELPQEMTIRTDITLEPQPRTSNNINDKETTDICGGSEKEAHTGSSFDSINLRQINIPAYKNFIPEFYYSTLENGWYCKICTNVSAVMPF